MLITGTTSIAGTVYSFGAPQFFSFLCSVVTTIVSIFVVVMVMSVFLPFTASDW